MSISPYRVAAPPSVSEEPEQRSCPDADVFPMFVLLWVASVVRVSVGLWQSEWFGPELTIATLVVLTLPLLAVRPLTWLVRRLMSVRS